MCYKSFSRRRLPGKTSNFQTCFENIAPHFLFTAKTSGKQRNLIQTMETQPIEKIALKNGLNIEIHDLSRPVAGDRWYIEIKVCISIPVEDHWFSSKLAAPADVATLRKSLGKSVLFEQRFCRNFIGADEKETIIHQMRNNMKENLQRYYSHPDFAASYLRKQYKKFLSLPPGYNI